MKKCKGCKLFIDEESNFCPYCGKKLWREVQKVKLENAAQKITVGLEEYKYKGEKRYRYVFYANGQEKISSLGPDFSEEIEDAWLIGGDKIIIVTSQQKIMKLRELEINKKGSKEICKLPTNNHRCSRVLYIVEDGRYLLWEKIDNNFYLINGNDILTYSAGVHVFNVELYSDDTVVCNQGQSEVYLLTSDGKVQTVSSLYDKDELLHRYHMQCVKADRFVHPEIIWDSPEIKSQTWDRNDGKIYVSFCCGRYRKDDLEAEFSGNPFDYIHEDTLTVELGEELPIGQIPPVFMETSEWEKEAADIRYMEGFVKKDHPEWKVHDRLCAFCNLGEDFLYGTGAEEQFLYERKHRRVYFFPPAEYGTKEEILKFALGYAEKHPDQVLMAQKLEPMHLLDSVTEKLIRTHETRLQPFFEYMKNAWQFDSMAKGETGYGNIMYFTQKFLADVDMIVGVFYTDESGKRFLGWKEQEVMYTEQVTGLLVRMNTPYGKKVVYIPFGINPLVKVMMADDPPANNRKEWYTVLSEQWKDYSRKEIPDIPTPYSTINVCSHAVNRVEMSRYHLYSDNYYLPERPSITSADLMYSPDGYELHPDAYIGSFYYKLSDSVKVAVEALTDIHLYALSRDGIFYIRDHQLYFRGRNKERKNYEGEYRDSVRLHVSDHYIFIECVDGYTQGRSYDSAGYTLYVTEFSVQYRTNVISRATGKCVAVWRDMSEITQLYQWDNHKITVATGKTLYEIADSDEGILSLSAPWDRQQKGTQVLTKKQIGEKKYALIEQYGIENFVGSMKDGVICMVVDGIYKYF